MNIEFSGWFQARLASDPDPTDEPRGISGCSFALPGEPDFDRIIRLQPSGTTPRIHGPQVGVKIRSLSGDVAPEAKEALIGADVELLGDARFVEQNGAVVPRNSAFIDPFDLCIRGREHGWLLRRKAVWDTDRPELSYYQVSSADLAPRQPELELKSSDVLQSSGVEQVDRYWADRLAALEADRTGVLAAKAVDPVELAGIEQRIENLKLQDWRNQRLNVLLAARAKYRFALQESASTTFVAETLRSSVATKPSWQVDFWMGAWDNDALCGYLSGNLQLPT